MSFLRILILAFCLATIGGAGYLSSQGVWGASSTVTSVRSGSGGGAYIGGLGRVK